MSDFWRVLVTGPITGIEDWLDAARAAGWEARSLPLQRLVPVDVPVDAPGLAAGDRDPDWIAITSSNALPALIAAAEARPLLREVRLAAVGDATAERALRAGLNPVLVPAPGASHAAGLAAELIARTGAGERILWPRGAAAAELASVLRAAGRVVDDPIVYRTEPERVPCPAPAADAVFFASPSAVRTWVASAQPNRPAAIAIGWTTYDALLETPDSFSTLLPLSEPSTAAFRLALESFFPSA